MDPTQKPHKTIFERESRTALMWNAHLNDVRKKTQGKLFSQRGGHVIYILLILERERRMPLLFSQIRSSLLRTK